MSVVPPPLGLGTTGSFFESYYLFLKRNSKELELEEEEEEEEATQLELHRHTMPVFIPTTQLWEESQTSHHKSAQGVKVWNKEGLLLCESFGFVLAMVVTPGVFALTNLRTPMKPPCSGFWSNWTATCRDSLGVESSLQSCYRQPDLPAATVTSVFRRCSVHKCCIQRVLI